MNVSISSQTNLKPLPSKEHIPSSQAVTPSLTIVQTPRISTDHVEIKKGLLPSVLGAGGGALAGGILAGAGSYSVASILGADSAELAIVLGGGLGAMAGAITGGVVANITDDKRKASLYGAIVGGGLGFGIGMAGGDIKSALTWGAIGAGAGVGGAFAGAAVAQRR